MRIAVDKNSYNLVKNDGNEYIYVFNFESYEELTKLNMHCVHYKYCPYVDIDTTEYQLECTKRSKIEEKDWNKLPEKKDYRFAIIVPNYNNDHGEHNGKTFFRNCIDSILEQTYKNFDLIIVDDCSTDTSVETVESYNDPRIHLIKNIRKRYNGGSRNVGIEYALKNLDFDYFCFLDSDDWWKHNEVLERINQRLYNHELMTLGCEMLKENGNIGGRALHEITRYEDLWSLNNKLWCTAWARVIRKDKIQYFCEDTLMEDRVWTYKIADNIDFKNVINLKEIVYVWNRKNVTNSVSVSRSAYWNASAYCHIGNQLQMISTLKHKEFEPELRKRIASCIDKVNNGIYQQY